MISFDRIRTVLCAGLLAAPSLLLPALPAEAAEDTLVLYSGRGESLVGPIVELFESETGIDVQVKYGKTAQLAVALQEEGAQSPADVFWGQDAGALGALSESGRFATLSETFTQKVPKRFRNDQGTWVAVSGRARTLAYSPQRVSNDELPESVYDLTEARWRERVGWAPTNASFQAFVTAMRVHEGEAKTRAWLEAMKANETKAYPKNTPIIQALAAGEIDLGLPNHYYLLRFKKSDSDYPVEQTFFAPGDVGNLVNVAGVGRLKTADHPEAANQFIEFLLSPRAQQYFASQTMEYPVIEGVIPNPELVSMKRLLEVAPEVDLDALRDLEGTLRLLQEVGLL